LAIKIKNGCTVLEEVKTISPTIPVIVLTDNSSEIVRQFASLLGAYGLIEKPCSYEFLVSCIRSSLRYSKGGA
jgi:DNA-binding response OmpR family regulator